MTSLGIFEIVTEGSDKVFSRAFWIREFFTWVEHFLRKYMAECADNPRWCPLTRSQTLLRCKLRNLHGSMNRHGSMKTRIGVTAQRLIAALLWD